MIRVEHAAEGFTVEVSPPHTRRPWTSPRPLTAAEVLANLEQLGVHSTDATDALDASGVPWREQHDAKVAHRRRRRAIWCSAVALVLHGALAAGVLAITKGAALEDWWHPSWLVIWLIPVALSGLALAGAITDAGRAPALAAVLGQVLWLAPVALVTFLIGLVVYVPALIFQVASLANARAESGSDS